jgi:hypothetical protein
MLLEGNKSWFKFLESKDSVADLISSLLVVFNA